LRQFCIILGAFCLSNGGFTFKKIPNRSKP
jgi:hypothetical protein